jgi:hypothetical protein
LHDVPAAALPVMQQAFPRLAKVVNGWQMNIDTIGVYGNFCIKRAVIAMMGLGANSAGDAVYPILMADADGNPLAGDYDHVLHFGETGLRPVHAFWSAAMYDVQAFRPRIPSAASRSVTLIRCSTSTTLAGRSISTFSTSRPAQARRPTGCRAAGPARRHNAALLPESLRA